jgi:hypothetical protein
MNTNVTVHSFTLRLFIIDSFIYPTDAQLHVSINVKIYMRDAPTCFGFPHPLSGSCYICFAKRHTLTDC